MSNSCLLLAHLVFWHIPFRNSFVITNLEVISQFLWWWLLFLHLNGYIIFFYIRFDCYCRKEQCFVLFCVGLYLDTHCLNTAIHYNTSLLHHSYYSVFNNIWSTFVIWNIQRKALAVAHLFDIECQLLHLVKLGTCMPLGIRPVLNWLFPL